MTKMPLKSGVLVLFIIFKLNDYSAEAEKNDYAAIEHTVESVQNSAVSGEKVAHVLYAALALYRAFQKVAHLRQNRGKKTD